MFTCVCVCVLVCVCAREEQRMEKSFAMLVNISLGHEVLGLVEERARTSVWVRSHCVFDTCSLMHFLLVASLRLGACVCTCVFVCVCVWGGGGGTGRYGLQDAEECFAEIVRTTIDGDLRARLWERIQHTAPHLAQPLVCATPHHDSNEEPNPMG